MAPAPQTRSIQLLGNCCSYSRCTPRPRSQSALICAVRPSTHHLGGEPLCTTPVFRSQRHHFPYFHMALLPHEDRRHDSLGSVPVASYRLVLPPSHCSRTSYRLRGPSVHSPEGLVFPSRAHPPTDAEPPTHIHLLPALNSEGRCDYQAPVRISKESINNAAAPSPTRCDSKAPPRISTESVNDAATPTSPYSRPRLRMDVDPTP